MKKLLSLLLVLTMVLSLAACGSKEEAPASTEATKSNESAEGTDAAATTEKQTVTIWAWDPNFNIAIMEKAKDMYMADHPDVEFEIVDFAKGDLEQKLHTNLASGITDDLPDIVLIEDYNAQKYLQAYPGSFEALTTSINYDNFVDYKVELMTVGEDVYGIPFDSGVSGMFYRRDAIEAAGFTTDDMQDITWDRFIEIAKEVEAKTDFQMLAVDPLDGGLMRVMLNSSGSWYFDNEGNATVANNEALIEAANVYKEIVNGSFTKQTSGWGEWVGAINNSDVASITTGVWIGGSVKAGEGQEGLWNVAATPRLNAAGSVNASNLGGSSWYVLSSSEEKAAAIDFLSKTYDADTSFYQEILVDNGAVASYIPSQSGEAYSAEEAFFNGQKVYEDFGQWMQEIPAINYGLYTYEADAAIMMFMPDVYSGSMTAEEAMVEAEKQLVSQIQ